MVYRLASPAFIYNGLHRVEPGSTPGIRNIFFSFYFFLGVCSNFFYSTCCRNNKALGITLLEMVIFLLVSISSIT
ncbi:hypothetical protein M501DRAFT_397327 [Patellaria atrata CBS 101060]|uniref:Uncharacterized protein n=1 Tax=Patellaria atrata CBS 101060 TaxID=1346257 RepID=A0A9P4SGF1_9PEZI|nr:hypothetical protein M501DRAFT_397327 [Patellaria atrata CBS 101060]